MADQIHLQNDWNVVVQSSFDVSYDSSVWTSCGCKEKGQVWQFVSLFLFLTLFFSKQTTTTSFNEHCSLYLVNIVEHHLLLIDFNNFSKLFHRIDFILNLNLLLEIIGFIQIVISRQSISSNQTWSLFHWKRWCHFIILSDAIFISQFKCAACRCIRLQSMLCDALFVWHSHRNYEIIMSIERVRVECKHIIAAHMDIVFIFVRNHRLLRHSIVNRFGNIVAYLIAKVRYSFCVGCCHLHGIIHDWHVGYGQRFSWIYYTFSMLFGRQTFCTLHASSYRMHRNKTWNL